MGSAFITTIILWPDEEAELPQVLTQTEQELLDLKTEIFRWGEELGFQQLGVSDINLHEAEQQLQNWLNDGRHGDMHYMHRHGSKRSHPEELVPGTVRVISARMDYLTEDQTEAQDLLDHPSRAYVSRYALGRDYHKVLRNRLKHLAKKIEDRIGSFGYRVFVDSAPVLEKPLAQKAGVGWVGKHTNIIHEKAGSWFFLGELYTDLPLPVDTPSDSLCGSCQACMDVCPTQAITGPYQLDARRCISYLTIEMREAIPVEFRKAIGNRIYGCDDCQIFCPWNKFAAPSAEGDFAPRHGLDSSELVDLFAWTEQEWLDKTQGSAIRRIGYTSWLRNVAVALGNATTSPAVISALQSRIDTPLKIVAEHVEWALQQHH